jgi:NitT/TauT family transport system permease protein
MSIAVTELPATIATKKNLLLKLRYLLRSRPELLLAPVLLVLFLLGWEFGVEYYEIPQYVIPAPSAIAKSLYRGLNIGFGHRGGYWLHTGVTLTEVFLGFIVGSSIGLILGTIVSQFRVLEATLRLYLVAIQSLPKIALAPIIVLWFGFGLTSKIVIICLLTFFPLLITSMAGFTSVEPERIELMRAICARPWQIFWKVRLPSALPYIFAGLEMAAVFSVVGAVVGEFVGAQLGLGTLIMSMNSQMDMAGTFSVLVILSIIGITLHSVLRILKRHLLFWSRNDSGAIGT